MARDRRCPDCGREGGYRDTVTRPLTDLPVGPPAVARRRPAGQDRQHAQARRGVVGAARRRRCAELGVGDRFPVDSTIDGKAIKIA